jgi:hypothetical protein
MKTSNGNVKIKKPQGRMNAVGEKRSCGPFYTKIIKTVTLFYNTGDPVYGIAGR